MYAPVSEGDELGELSISYGGHEIRRIALCAAEDAEYKSAPAKKKKKSLFFRK